MALFPSNPATGSRAQFRQGQVKALCWHGKHDIRYDTLPDPKIMGAEFCNIQPGDTIAVWGCGPVGQMAIRSCFLLGAKAGAGDRYGAGAARIGARRRSGASKSRYRTMSEHVLEKQFVDLAHQSDTAELGI